MVRELIDRVDRWLARNRPEYYARLQPGVTGPVLDAFESRFALKLPEAFRQFYQWRNGQEPGCHASFQDNRMFSSLEEVAETKALLDGMIGSDFEDPRWWRRGWVPFLANGGGDHLCLDVAAEDGGTPGQLVAFWHDWEDRSVEYSSFEAWLRRLADSMEAGTLELS
jgi:cell wall assembly regulator SMI1